MKLLHIVATTFVILSGAANAFASPIVTLLFAGEVEQEAAVLPSLPIGTEVRFVVPFDYGAVNTCDPPDELSGFYSFPGSTIWVGGLSYASTFTFLEVNSPDGNCQASGQQSLFGATLRLLPVIGAPFASATIDLDSSFGDTPSSIPTHIFPTGFSINYIGHGFGGPAAAVGGLAPPVVVPEPALSVLALAGLLVAIRRRLTRRSHAVASRPSP